MRREHVSTAPTSTPSMMAWQRVGRADPRAAALADRHYSRKTPGAPQFSPPGRCLVLLTSDRQAVWVSSWPYAEFAKHDWAGAWLCTLFRNESPALSSVLIVQAIAATRYHWGPPPTLGMVTFVDPARVQSPNPGHCFKRAGFQRVGHTKSGLVVLQLRPEGMPPAAPALGTQLSLFPREQREVPA